MRDDFAILVLSHGRANSVITMDTLWESGYTGRWYIVIDNEDTQAQQYRDRFGSEHVIMFDKLAKSREFDTCDMPYARRDAIVYARNASFDIARGLGLRYFMELDDDYREFKHRFVRDGMLSSSYVRDMDSILEAMIEFLDTSGALSIAMSQMGDFIGGQDCAMLRKRVTRKCMNSFLCRTDRPFTFIGRVNEDVNTYVWRASRGELMLTVCDISLNQLDTQQKKGGMTGLYESGGTYLKSFYSVMVNPSSVRISTVGDGHMRFHHVVDWDACAPKILSGRFRNRW